MGVHGPSEKHDAHLRFTAWERYGELAPAENRQETKRVRLMFHSLSSWPAYYAETMPGDIRSIFGGWVTHTSTMPDDVRVYIYPSLRT